MDEEMIARMRGAMLETGIVIGASSWPDEQEVAADRLARAAHSVMAGKVAELEKQRLMILTAVYGEAPKFVATICDEKLDRSGALLGQVRELHRAALAQTKGTDR